MLRCLLLGFSVYKQYRNVDMMFRTNITPHPEHSRTNTTRCSLMFFVRIKIIKLVPAHSTVLIPIKAIINGITITLWLKYRRPTMINAKVVRMSKGNGMKLSFGGGGVYDDITGVVVLVVVVLVVVALVVVVLVVLVVVLVVLV